MIDKQKAIALKEQGLTNKEVAQELGCSEDWCKRNLKGINDVCQNYTGCQVTFKIKQTSFTDSFGENKARLTGNGFSFMSDTVKADGNYITFAFDNIS